MKDLFHRFYISLHDHVELGTCLSRHDIILFIDCLLEYKPICLWIEALKPFEASQNYNGMVDMIITALGPIRYANLPEEWWIYICLTIPESSIKKHLENIKYPDHPTYHCKGHKEGVDFLERLYIMSLLNK